MPLENIDLDGPDIAALPEVTEVDWALVKDRVEASIDAWGIHAVREHYLAGIWAYEDQTRCDSLAASGGCPEIIARDIIAPIVDKVISKRF